MKELGKGISDDAGFFFLRRSFGFTVLFFLSFFIFVFSPQSVTRSRHIRARVCRRREQKPIGAVEGVAAGEGLRGKEKRGKKKKKRERAGNLATASTGRIVRKENQSERKSERGD